MKPNFALILSHEEIGLLHRVAGNWVRVGAVAIDDPELGAALSFLRRSALGLEPHGISTKVVIPASEVLYTSVHAPGPDDSARRSQIAAALEGMTPYAVSDLAFDWTGTSDEVQVAVVARETLAEAEAFALDHRFNPVSFVAMPEPDRFDTEPFFGPSAQAAMHLGAGETIERDKTAIILSERPFAQETTTLPETAPAIPSPPHDQPPDPLDIAQQTTPALPEPFTAHIAPAGPIASEPADDPADDPADPFAPSVASSPVETPSAPPQLDAESITHPKPSTPPVRDLPPEEPAPLEPAIDAPFANSPLDEATPLGPDPAPGVPAQTPASAQDRRDHSDPGTDLPETLSGAAAGDTETPAPPSSFADAPDGGPQTLDAGPDGVSPTQDSPETQPDNMPDAPPPFANPASSDLSVADDPDTQSWPGEDDEREGAPEQIRAVPRRGRKPAKTGKKLAGVARTAPAAPMPERKVMVGPRAEPDAPQVDQPRTEAEAMTVFGARNQTIGGKPRYLGLILTGALLLVLAVVAIWAAFFLDGPERPAQQGAAPDATAVAPATDGLALAPTEPDAAAPPEDLAAPPAETPPEDLAEAPAEDPPQEAATRQAATPQTADADPESAAPDNSLPAENIALPRPDGALANPLADLRLSAAQPQPAPPSHAAGLPPFDALFQFDAEGRLVATAEGVVTPDGYRLVAARPEILPPPRPGSDQPSNTTPDVAAQPEPMPPTTESPVEPADPLAEDPGQDTAAGSIAAASLAPQSPDADPAASTPDPLASPPEDPALVFAPDTTGPVTRPLQRPLGIAPPTEDPAQPEAEASTQPEQESSITSPRPPARPASVVAQARRAAETEQASVLAAAAAAASAASTAAIDSGSESALTIASSRRPAARPPNFARAVEAAVAAAVAPPVGTARPTAPSRSEDEDEPEAQVSRSAPNIPTSANVAKQATQARALNLGRLALIGVYGTANNRQALVREPGGRMVRVKVGDRLDGGRVTAITASELRYQKGSSVNALVMPKG